MVNCMINVYLTSEIAKQFFKDFFKANLVIYFLFYYNYMGFRCSSFLSTDLVNLFD